MGQKGFGTKEIIAFVFVIALSLCVVAFLYNDLSKNNGISLVGDAAKNNLKSTSSKVAAIEANNYEELENIISEKSQIYFSNNAVNIVSLITLNQNEYIPTIYSLDKIKIDCKGYVVYDDTMINPKTYLNCGDSYKTLGYDMSKETNY